MNKIFAILGIIFLTGTVFAIGPIPDPVMDQKYQETNCWAMYADTLISYAQGYYGEPPPYLQAMRDQLWGEGGEMYQLYTCGAEDDRACFNAQLKNVMNLVRQMQGAFWKESVLAIVGGDALVGDVAGFFTMAADSLSSCLEGRPVET